MSHVNSVTVSGNLTADPELRHTPSGLEVGNLRMAVNRQKKNDDGGYDEEASFFSITVFGKFAELCARKLRKGNPITVQGRLREDRWEAEDGSKRSKVVIVANEIDAQAFFQKDADVAPLSDGGTTTSGGGGSTAPAATDDDIPF